jgi:sulfatase maturation enzyme AslB (radical SAM superfamily)
MANVIPVISKELLDADMQWIYDSRNMTFEKNAGIEHYCDVPFITVNVDAQGRVFLCGCQHWLPVPVGNILDFNSFEEVFQSTLAKEIQSSILDRSYRYCDIKTCDLQDRLKEYPELRAFKGDNYPHTKPIKLVLNIDNSCNLTCPSCRTEFKFVNEGPMFDYRMKLSAHISALVTRFKDNIQFEVAGDGDPFASIVYRTFLSSIRLTDPMSTVIINTNGLLIKEHWGKLYYVEDQIDTIKISVDAGSELVYDITRRLGSWDKLLDNIEWLVQYKRANKKSFSIATNFVVQKANVHDIKNYVRLMLDIGVDVIYLQKVTDWGTWRGKFDDVAVWKEGHPDHNAMRRSLDLIKDMPKVHLTNLIDYAIN